MNWIAHCGSGDDDTHVATPSSLTALLDYRAAVGPGATEAVDYGGGNGTLAWQGPRCVFRAGSGTRD
ncbi:hypothetical protein Ntsu_79850 [Nocardia sp. IFM 10818]